MYVVLERACLETGKVGKEHVLLNADDHANFLRKHKRDPNRPRGYISAFNFFTKAERPELRTANPDMGVCVAERRRCRGCVRGCARGHDRGQSACEPRLGRGTGSFR